jgi:hypothetical protein
MGLIQYLHETERSTGSNRLRNEDRLGNEVLWGRNIVFRVVEEAVNMLVKLALWE